MEFGLYAWRPDGSADRVLKEGARTLVRGACGVCVCAARRCAPAVAARRAFACRSRVRLLLLRATTPHTPPRCSNLNRTRYCTRVRQQVRYFKSLPASMAALRAVAARMARDGSLPGHEDMHAAAAGVKAGLAARGAGAGRKHQTLLTTA